jgi:hypothetical protein
VPHLRDGSIVAKVGIVRSTTVFPWCRPLSSNKREPETEPDLRKIGKAEGNISKEKLHLSFL